MHITLVKKIMEDGKECKKCREVMDRLEESGELKSIDSIVIADVRDPSSEGMVIAEKHDVKIAPFFVVEENGEETIYKSYMQFRKKVLEAKPASASSVLQPDFQASGPSSSRRHKFDIDELNRQFEDKTPQELLEWGLENFHPKIALAWSGAEDVAVVDMLLKINPDARIFTLDTGRLNQETYDLIDAVRDKYNIEIEVIFPDSPKVEAMVREFGVNLFYDSVENRKLCCGVRKVGPLKKILSGLDAWITGLRKDQSVTRTVIRKIETDESKGGILKINPIAAWTNEDVLNYIKENDVPYNELHDSGYISIGCAPCTRAVNEGEDARSGRWWWEDPEDRECGLHVKSKG